MGQMNIKKEKIYFDSLIIEGDQRFILWTKQALRLLKLKVPSVYQRVIQKYVKKIKLTKTTGMNLFVKIPTYEVGSKTAYASLKWYASTIAHDAYHAKLYFDYKKNSSRPVPLKIYNSKQAELLCIKYQIKVGKKIGLSKLDLDYLKTLDGSHAKLKKRDW